MKKRGFRLPSMVQLMTAVMMMAIMIGTSIPAPAQITSVRDASAAFVKEVTFYASGSRTGPGNTGTPIDLSAYDSATILINTTVAGTTMTVNFDNCIDAAGTKCGAHTSSTAITTTGFTVIKANNFGRWARISFTSTGAFTFEVYGAFKPST